MYTHTFPYTPYINVIEQIKAKGFNKSLFNEAEELATSANQLFLVADLLQLKIIYTSKELEKILGIGEHDFCQHDCIQLTHPDHRQRHVMYQAKLVDLASDVYASKYTMPLLSTNFMMRDASGTYSNIMVQCLLFYCKQENETVYLLKIITPIDAVAGYKNACHFYMGNDLTYFRYPDKELLKLGCLYSEREMEIMKLIEIGMSSKNIAEKLHISPNTINTHRKNIIKKSGKASIPNLLYTLKEQGAM